MNEKLNTSNTNFCDLTEAELTNIDGGGPITKIIVAGVVIAFVSGVVRGCNSGR